MFSPVAVMFRLISVSFIGYIVYTFVQDEKIVEDIKELTVKGMSDLFDYNKEWDLGKLKLNTDKKSFKDKYEQEMNQ